MVKKLESFIKRFYLLIIFVFLYTPIVTLMIFSFNDSKSTAKWNGFTLRWYSELFQNTRIMDALKYTLISFPTLALSRSGTRVNNFLSLSLNWHP